MKTPTIQHVNALGCCCPFPLSPANRWKHQDRAIDPYKYLYVPFIKPAGADDDEIPKLWDNAAGQTYKGNEGEASWYEGWNENPTASGEWGEVKQSLVVSYDLFTPEPGNGWAATTTVTVESNESNDGPPFSDASAGPGSVTTTTDPTEVYNIQFTHQYSVSTGPAYSLADADYTDLVTSGYYDVDETSWFLYDDKIRYWTTALDTPLQGPGGDEGVSSYFFDITELTAQSVILSDEFTKDTFITAEIEELDPEPYSPTVEIDVPEASTELESWLNAVGAPTNMRWPWIGDLTWPGAPDYGIDSQSDRPDDFKVTAHVLGLKYKVGIPEDWETKNAAWWAWHLAGETGPEPAGKRSVFECEWDEVFFPKAWEEWREDHQAWIDGGMVGDEPTKPTATEDKPSLVTSRSWNYGGPGSNPFSDFFFMDPPSSEGKVRPVNMMIISYHSSRVGVKPTLIGEYINLDNP